MSFALVWSRFVGPAKGCNGGSTTIAGRRGEMDPVEGWKVRYSDGSGDFGREIFRLNYLSGAVT